MLRSTILELYGIYGDNRNLNIKRMQEAMSDEVVQGVVRIKNFYYSF